MLDLNTATSYQEVGQTLCYEGGTMVSQPSLLVSLVCLVDKIPMPPAPPQGRGHPKVYPDRLFLKALVVMILRRLHKVHELLTVLEQPTPEMRTLRDCFLHNGQFPSRRTWDRRLKAIPATLPAQIHCLGRRLVDLLQPWLQDGRAVAIDSTVLRARGGVWHKKDREKGIVPHTSIDTQAAWTKSGWHGWVYGWKLHLVGAVASIWIPLAARLTPANVADKEIALLLIPEIPTETRFVLGDTHYNDPDVRQVCQAKNRILVATRRGKYPHTDSGVEARRVFHKLRSGATENFNEHFKSIFDANGQVPTKGLVNTQRFVLGAVFVYQVGLFYRVEDLRNPCVGLKPFLRAA